MLTQAAVIARTFDAVISNIIVFIFSLHFQDSRRSETVFAILGLNSISVLCCKSGAPNSFTPPTPEKVLEVFSSEQ